MGSRFKIWTIVALVLVATWINLPHVPAKIPEFSSRLHVFGKDITIPLVDKLSGYNLSQLTDRFPVRLGLDLQGGTELVLQTQMDKINPEDRDIALESSRQVIERRVNPQGVSEVLVQSSRFGEQRRIIVELPGVKDASQAAELIGRTAELEFRETHDDLSPQAAEATKSGLPLSTAQIYDAKPTGLTGKELKKAEVVFGQTQSKGGGPQIKLQFNDEGTKKFAEITKRNVGKPLVIFLDNDVLQAPVVQQEILDGSPIITGSFTPEEAKQIVTQLNAGALPVPISVLSSHTIPATLGAESIHRSIIAGLIGIVTVMIYMIANYGLYGLIADIALIIYTLLLMAIMRTGLFLIPPVTLTLAGIAGVILSIGMAVDANILIFERMKEEVHAGKKGPVVLTLGFNRAWSSIKDSNISSLITAFILYSFGTTVVKGFALTLAIGVLVSMFSAITVSRTILRLLPRFRK